MSEFKYDISKEIVISEVGNKSVKLSYIKWNDSNDEKVDIRNWFVDSQGENKMGKGVSLSKDAANELTNALLEEGFGSDKVLLKELEERTGEDLSHINLSVRITPNDDEDYEEIEYIDPEKII